MSRVRQLALVLGLGLLGSFVVVMVVHYLLPVDPLRIEPLVNFRLLFAIVFLVMCSALQISFVVARRESKQ